VPENVVGNVFVFGRFKPKRWLESADNVKKMMLEAKSYLPEFRHYPHDRIIKTLERTGKAWTRQEYAPRKFVIEHLPNWIGVSSELASILVEEVGKRLDRERLVQWITKDLGHMSYLSEWRYQDVSKSYFRATPVGTLLFELSHLSFIDNLDFLLQGLLTKNITILKLKGAVADLLQLIARTVCEHDDDNVLSKAFSILTFDKPSDDVYSILRENSDLVIFDEVEQVPTIKRARTLVLEKPVGSVALLLDRTVFEDPEVTPREIAYKIVNDLILLDNNPETYLNLIYVENSAKHGDNANALVSLMIEAFRHFSKLLPPGKFDARTILEINREREKANIERITSGREIYASEESLDWTMFVDRELSPEVPSLPRTVYLKPVEHLEAAAAELITSPKNFKNVGVWAPLDRKKSIAAELVAAGVQRISKVGEVFSAARDVPIGPVSDLNKLVRWVSIETSFTGYDEFDYIDGETRNELVFEKISYLFGFARDNSPFYRKHFARLEVSDYRSFHALPFMTEEMLVRNSPPFSNALLTGDPEGTLSTVGESTGGFLQFTLRNEREYMNEITKLSKGLLLAGLKRGNIVANLLNLGSLYDYSGIAREALLKRNVLSIPFTRGVATEMILEILAKFGVDTILATPNTARFLARLQQKEKVRGIKIERLIFGGEPLSTGTREFLKEIFGTTRFISAFFLHRAAGLIGYQCPKCMGALHHVHEDHHYVEVIDQSSSEHVSDGVTGEIVLTSLESMMMPIIRMKAGLLGRFLRKKCSCGRGTRLLQVVGPSDSSLQYGPLRIHADDIASAIDAVDGLSTFFQIVASSDRLRESVTVTAEVAEGSTREKGELSRELRESLMAKVPPLEELVTQGEINELRIHIIDSGKLPRDPESKRVLRAVIDER
jgi:phenylacetate-CoA ligase